MAEPSITVEEFDSKYANLIDKTAELIMGHPDIPEEVDQSEILSGIIILKKELENSLHNRVPEAVKYQEEIERLKRQNDKLKDTNQQLFLQVGRAPDPSKQTDEGKPPKRSFEEIRRMLDSL